MVITFVRFSIECSVRSSKVVQAESVVLIVFSIDCTPEFRNMLIEKTLIDLFSRAVYPILEIYKISYMCSTFLHFYN